MAQCDPKTLMADASCFNCVPPGMWMPLKLVLLSRWLKALNPSADTSVQGLMRNASCFTCIPPGLFGPLRLALLCRIFKGGGSTPATPANFDISNSSSKFDVVITWTQSVVPQFTEVWRSINGGVFVQVGNVAGNLTTFHDTAGIPKADVWTYKLRATTSGTSSVYTITKSIGNDLNFDNTGAVSVSYPDMVICLGDLVYRNQAAMVSFSAPMLRKVVGYLVLDNDPLVATVTLTALATLGGGIQLNSASMTTVNLNALQSTGVFDVSTSGLTSLSLPALTVCNGDFAFFNCPSLVSVSCPALTNTSGSILGSGCASLTSVSLPVLVSNGNGNLDCNTCPLLTTVSLPVWNIFDAGLVITFDSCGLNAASVNQILHRGAVSATTTNDYELGNGTNLAPSGQGIVDKATLVGAGNTVNTN